MARPAAPLPPDLVAPFSLAEASAAGVSRRRLRARDLAVPFRGVRAESAPAPRPAYEGPYDIDPARSAHAFRTAREYACIMSPHSFFCGATAAALWGFPVGPVALLDVCVLAPMRAPRRRGIQGRKIESHLAEVTELNGLSLTTPSTTWAMLGAELGVRALVRLGDALVRIPRDERGRPVPSAQLTTIEELRNSAGAGRRLGAARLRRALELIRVGAMSPLETDLRLLLDDAGLPEPALDVEVRDPDGRLIAILDAAYPGPRVAIEAEGDHHRTDAAQWARDIERQAALTAHGWEVVRVTSAHIRGRERRAVSTVRDALQRRGGVAAGSATARASLL